MRLIEFLFFGGYDKAIALAIKRTYKGKQTKIFTPNAEILHLANKNKELLPLIENADIPFPDGIGAYLGSRLLGYRPRERTNGIDLAERLLAEASKRHLSVFLLGAKQGVAERAAKQLETKYSGLSIVGVHHGYFDKNGEDNDELIKKIDSSDADILFVCFGFPIQERWIYDNLPKLKSVKIAVGLGGSIDVWSGKTRRAPRFVRRLGFEWLWRVAYDPARITRTVSIFDFMGHCFAAKISNLARRKSNLLQNR